MNENGDENLSQRTCRREPVAENLSQRICRRNLSHAKGGKMTNQIHGHAVMEMMLETEKIYTDATLIEAIEKRFGTDTSFFTCSASEMNAAELVNFLKSKGKFMPSGEGYILAGNTMCSH